MDGVVLVAADVEVESFELWDDGAVGGEVGIGGRLAYVLPVVDIAVGIVAVLCPMGAIGFEVGDGFITESFGEIPGLLELRIGGENGQCQCNER